MPAGLRRYGREAGLPPPSSQTGGGEGGKEEARSEARAGARARPYGGSAEENSPQYGGQRAGGESEEEGDQPWYGQHIGPASQGGRAG